MFKIIKTISILLMAAILACSSGPDSNKGADPDATGSLVLSLEWPSHGKTASNIKRTPPVGVATIRITVSGPGMMEMTQDFSATAGSGQLDVIPAGSSRTIAAQGLDPSGNVTHTGSIAGITINIGQTTDAGTIVMNSVIATYSISGAVSYNSSGLSGVTITLSGAGSGSATTDSSGNYTLSGVANGSYTVTPLKSGYSFSPSSASVTVSGANQIDQNFSATVAQSSTLVSVTNESAGANCYTGGKRVDSGWDTDGNGTIDVPAFFQGDFFQREFYCNSGEPTLNVLIFISEEPAGTICSLGGKKIDVGYDLNSNGILDTSELTTYFDYWCAQVNCYGKVDWGIAFICNGSGYYWRKNGGLIFNP